MTTAIHRRVTALRAGADPTVIARLPSGWAVFGEWPDGWAALGGLAILASALLLARAEARRPR